MENIKKLDCGCLYAKITPEDHIGCPEYLKIETSNNCTAPTHGTYDSDTR